MTRQHFFWAGAVIVVGLGVGLLVKNSIGVKGPYRDRYLDGRMIPLDGLLLNPHSLDGLKNDTEVKFGKIGHALQTYIQEKGSFPTDFRDLFAYTQRWPVEERVTEETLQSTDFIKSDRYSPEGYGNGKFSTYRWACYSPRVDGSPRPPFPKPGERDIWLESKDYFRSGTKVYRDMSRVSHPEGFFVVLWSDGKVERLPPSSLRAVKTGGGSVYAFVGEPGVPKDAPVFDGGVKSRDMWGDGPHPRHE